MNCTLQNGVSLLPHWHKQLCESLEREIASNLCNFPSVLMSKQANKLIIHFLGNDSSDLTPRSVGRVFFLFFLSRARDSGQRVGGGECNRNNTVPAGTTARRNSLESFQGIAGLREEAILLPDRRTSRGLDGKRLSQFGLPWLRSLRNGCPIGGHRGKVGRRGVFCGPDDAEPFLYVFNPSAAVEYTHPSLPLR